ncbi:pyridoxamine 5'-phosphate oxidase [Saccharobesus litoralis]|uniref:Pyridoxine/pyridoxamine 5'-phosphate oxidase n=1 Tax=Saccharobesus litoralis TaxID=2172099 RepID=A0A2S0VVJ0_9ALTE|nr:pyridoxamine 5'-phosphate oxidase [Saccharobesus litoralis]AWB68192.1 pyridoxamine 5'-phosphate oxidase [Saccharobesus litoralis]
MSIFYEVRREYDLTHLNEQALTESPYGLFQLWYDELVAAKVVKDTTAMIVATVDQQHKPYQRTVLMKSFDEQGFVFYTNQHSRKGQHIANNNQVCLMFPWLAMERQIIVNGVAEKVSDDESDNYFASRPISSQVAAVVSQQSQPVDSRETLEAKFHELMAFYQDKPVPRPPHWGGYRVKPTSIEFWQGGENRIHDRFIYELDPQAQRWQITRLQP